LKEVLERELIKKKKIFGFKPLGIFQG